jgi:hypothetical protein
VKPLYKFEILDLCVLGILLPVLMVSVVTFILVTESHAVLPLRRFTGDFYGYEAYAVSSIWYGGSLALFSKFFLAPTLFRSRESKLVAIYWVSLILVGIGLASGIVFTIL